jgi:hypothetical protein
MRTLFLAATLAACAPVDTLPDRSPPPGDTDPTGGGDGGPTDTDPIGGGPVDDPTGADEHPNEPDDGVSAEWLDGPAGADVTLRTPALTLAVSQAGTALRTVVLTPTGDAGSLQTLRRLPSVMITSNPTAPVPVTVDFSAMPTAGQTHAGELSVEVRSCPLGFTTGPGCFTTTLSPLYFHRDAAGDWVVYDALGLCRAHGCGDLSGQTPAEPGGGRVLGGAPMRALRATDRRAPEGPERNQRFPARADDLNNPT